MDKPVNIQDDLDITLFVPCYNEEANVIPTLETIQEAMREVRRTYEIIVWDDCSKDATVPRVEEYIARHPEAPIQLVRNDRNRGLARNYVDCAFAGRGKYYKIVSGDNAEPKEDMVAILSRLGEAEIIIPYLRNDIRVPGRRFLSRVFTGLVNLLGGFHLQYYNGAALHLRYNVMRWHSDTYGFAYQAEILTRLMMEGASWLEVPINNVESGGRVSKALSFKNLMSVGHSLLQIFLRRLRRIIFKS